jgi:hypothetical protein
MAAAAHDRPCESHRPHLACARERTGWSSEHGVVWARSLSHGAC